MRNTVSALVALAVALLVHSVDGQPDAVRWTRIDAETVELQWPDGETIARFRKFAPTLLQQTVTLPPDSYLNGYPEVHLVKLSSPEAIGWPAAPTADDGQLVALSDTHPVVFPQDLVLAPERRLIGGQFWELAPVEDEVVPSGSAPRIYAHFDATTGSHRLKAVMPDGERVVIAGSGPEGP